MTRPHTESTLLPPLTTPLEQALEGATARLSAVPRPLETLWQPYAAPTAFLPWLAWQMSVDLEWGLCRTDAERRTLIARSLELHRHKGTAGALERALDVFGIEAEVIEWFQPTGREGGLRPYEFALRAHLHRPLDPKAFITPELPYIVGDVVEHYKNVRSHLAWLVLTLHLHLDLGLAESGLEQHRITRDATTVRLPLWPVLDVTALDARALDPELFRSTRVVSDRSALFPLRPRLHHLDRLLPEGVHDRGLHKDRALDYREGEPLSPLDSIQTTSRRTTGARVGAPSLATRRCGRRAEAFDLAPTLATGRHHRDASRITAAPLNTPLTGLDRFPAFDGLPLDAAPLDLPLETCRV